MGGKNRWTEVDRALALAYERHVGEKCKNCGTTRDDWFDEDGYPLEEPVFEIAVKQCEGCLIMHRGSEAIKDAPPGTYATWAPFGSVVLAPDEEESWSL
jgi:hypothetical protein